MTMIRVRPLRPSDDGAIDRLAEQARIEGFRFLDRLRQELAIDNGARDTPRAFFLVIEDESGVVGVGGVTEDPYAANSAVGRIRHVYIAAETRRRGLGRMLVAALETRACCAYAILRLRTDTEAGARFYEALGYGAVADSSATHVKQ